MLTARNLLARLTRVGSRALRSERGAVAPLIGLMMLVLIGCAGIAIDTGRAMVVKARLVSALDAAGLAVGARTTTTDYTVDARKFVDANFKANYAGAKVETVTASLSSDKATITLGATATMPTIFMKLFGSKSVTVNAATEIVRASTGLELALVLDNTGSMELSGSMPSLKEGAKSLVESLFSGDPDDVFVGLVPFSQAVNVGTSTWAKDWVTSNTNDGYPDYWTGCVEARQKGLDQTDDPPTASITNSKFTAYYSPDTEDYYTVNRIDKDAQVNDWIRYSSRGRKSYSVFYTSIYESGQQGPEAYCPTAITPMTNTKSKVIAGIDAMTAQGSTFINLGAIWGWRMLSERWRGYWGGDMASLKLPLNYNTKNMNKAVVLMTDGENTFGAKTYTAYGYLKDNRLDTTSASEAVKALNTRLTAACNSMKAKGILVMTIAYDNPDATTKTLLQSCATNTSYYFDAGSSSDLISAFQRIYGALSKLRVSK